MPRDEKWPGKFLDMARYEIRGEKGEGKGFESNAGFEPRIERRTRH